MSERPFAARVVACPRCRGESAYAPTNPYRPFCSARCKNADLGAWGSEAYRVEEVASRDSREGQEHDDEHD